MSTRSGSLLFLALLVFIGAALYADTALAIGNDANVGSFSCANGKASGQLYAPSASCPTTLGTKNLFSFLVCNMEQLSSNVMGHMYCGMIKSFEPMIWSVTTLAILIFGISFMIGLTSLSRGGAIMFAIKIAFVTAFATNADILIGVGYKFFLAGISDGVTIVLSRAGNEGMTTGADVYKLLDGFIEKGFQFATDSMSATNAAERCKNAIFAVLVTMGAAFPMLAYFGLALLARIVITLFRAVFAYVYAIVGITFLMILAPIFLAFYMFKQTQSFFQKWLGYLVSFAMQVVLLFTFITFILTLDVSSLTKNLPNIIMFNTKAVETTSFRFPWEYCTLCDFKIVEKAATNSDGSTSSTAGKEMSADDPNLLRKGELQCKKYPTTDEGVDSEGRKPISFTFAVAPKQGTNDFSALVALAGQGVLAMIILAWIVERLLSMVPRLAQRLSSGMGASYAPQLGGGSSTGAASLTMPGESLMRDFQAGFDRGFSSSLSNADRANRYALGKSNGIRAAGAGARDGFSMMVTGRTASGEQLPVGRDADGAPIHGGITNTFSRWLADPGRFGQ